VAALLCRDLLEDIFLESMVGISSMVVWQMSLAPRLASFGRAYLLIYSPGVSCWDSLVVQWGVRLVSRFLVVVGFWWRCAFGGGVPRRVWCLMASLSGELRPITNARLYNAHRLCNCNGRAGCSALPTVVFGRPCLVWWCGLFV
jgi:hypothetical protein